MKVFAENTNEEEIQEKCFPGIKLQITDSKIITVNIYTESWWVPHKEVQRISCEIYYITKQLWENLE